MLKSRSTLVLGGAASGKSIYAEGLLTQRKGRLLYIATAKPTDGEMFQKVSDHRSRRGELWTTIEEPLGLVEVLERSDESQALILVDCLTLWLSNLMEAQMDILTETKRLVETINEGQGRLVLVSNETGSGVVPDNALARNFRNLQGRLNQEIAAAADEVILITAGIPLILKNPTV